MWELAYVGAGLPALQATRSVSYCALMLSQASQLPQKPALLQTSSHTSEMLQRWGYFKAAMIASGL
ncbi:hypothetical protein FEM54_21410 [Pseudomonas edaphica]|uniref:Uncharacterized protein n=1 Tax=Pseudomonas edaphica TaxID=2006980 RepID=A0ABY2U0J1_9PSED|nr:hypothetical protein FEM54_21410 [Pseudomonas edaphica]